MKSVAIIPARGGSKRLPRKNILPINGQPMLSYPVKTAVDSGLFDQVIVSTEDSEISSIAINSGAIVVNRPVELANDHAQVTQVCKHVLELLKTQHSLPDYMCCIYATAIFITSDDIINAFHSFSQLPEADVVMGVSEFNLQPLQALRKEAGFLKPMWPEYATLQSQCHPNLVASNGTFYWVRTKAFLRTQSFYCSRLKGYTIPNLRAIDIDTEDEFVFAKLVAKQLL